MSPFKLAEAKKHVESLWYKVYYIAIYGSQNYGLDLDEEEYKSDIDYKTIVLPSLLDLVNNSKPVSKVYEFNWWQIDVKDLRVYVESMVKCNINFLEIMNSEYFIWPNELRELLPSLMEESWQFFLKACYGMALEKQVAMEHEYPSTKYKITKYGYDPKQLHHIARLCEVVKDYVRSGSFTFTHPEHVREYLLKIKRGEYSLSFARNICEMKIEEIKKLRNSYTIPPKFEAKENILDLSKKIVYNSIVGSMKKLDFLEFSFDK